LAEKNVFSLTRFCEDSTIDKAKRQVAARRMALSRGVLRRRNQVLAQQPYQTFEFGNEQKVALALTGTVAIPSPFPAAARIFIGIMPRLNAASAERYFLKIVEVIADKHIATWFVNVEDIRAVRLRPESGQYQELREWTLRTAEDLHEELEDAKRSLKQAASHPMTAYEFLLFPDLEGVVYIPETAPVLVRTEYGLPAAEAFEYHCSNRMRLKGRCCTTAPPVVDEAW
jgi:hypothetical protein